MSVPQYCKILKFDKSKPYNKNMNSNLTFKLLYLDLSAGIRVAFIIFPKKVDWYGYCVV